MGYQVAILHVASGEVRMDQINLNWNNDVFWWTEGNMSCDCNLHREWHRAGGPGPADDPHWNNLSIDCSDGLYRALYALLPSGERVELMGPMPAP